MADPHASDADAGARGVRVRQPVRWGDMDALGHVNNTVLFQYCESARIAYFEAVGLESFQQKATDGPGLVQADLAFKRQMRYPGEVLVEAHVTRIGGRSFVIGYTLTDAADGAVVAEGSSVCVWVDYEAGRAMALPQALRARIAALEHDEGLLGADR